ncbi:amino acid permease-domain-containing protein [Earliella scabrosa]|nr:amino acid permease-domain-containing protein [Earliella scabrosa]
MPKAQHSVQLREHKSNPSSPPSPQRTVTIEIPQLPPPRPRLWPEVSTPDALRYGGPVGAFLGYMIVGTVVYCLCVSIAEMIAYLPNVGGVVGLADLYVDPALGFSMGWASWYNFWAIALPEISAAAVVIGYWDEHTRVPVAVVGGIFLTIATAVKCFLSGYYGEMEFFLSCMKVITIIVIFIACFAIDLGASPNGLGRLGFRQWRDQPFPASYFGVSDHLGRFLGFWAVIMRSS